VALITVQSVIVVVSLTFIVIIIATSPTSSKDPEIEVNGDWMQAQYYFIISTFGLLLLVYVTVLTLLVARLKKYYPQFFKRERKQIYFASISVIVSIIARMTINIVYSIDSVNEALEESFREDTWLFPLS
jgi:hypothetical protein